MELYVKKFDELSTAQLYDILAVRSRVFVEEQKCTYTDLDGKDIGAYHVWMCEAGEIVAYLRVLDKGVSFDDASIGRVLSLKRRCGIGTRIVTEGIKLAKEKFGADRITIEAQSYVKDMYEKLGFVQVSDEFLDVGIPHVKMVLEIKD